MLAIPPNQRLHPGCCVPRILHQEVFEFSFAVQGSLLQRTLGQPSEKLPAKLPPNPSDPDAIEVEDFFERMQICRLKLVTKPTSRDFEKGLAVKEAVDSDHLARSQKTRPPYSWGKNDLHDPHPSTMGFFLELFHDIPKRLGAGCFVGGDVLDSLRRFVPLNRIDGIRGGTPNPRNTRNAHVVSSWFPCLISLSLRSSHPTKRMKRSTKHGWLHGITMSLTTLVRKHKNRTRGVEKKMQNPNDNAHSPELLTITWQIGKESHRLRNTIVSPGETLEKILPRILSEAASLGYLQEEDAFFRPHELQQRWQVTNPSQDPTQALQFQKDLASQGLQEGALLLLLPLVPPQTEASLLDDPPLPRGGGAGAVFLSLLILLLIAGVVFFFHFYRTSSTPDDPQGQTNQASLHEEPASTENTEMDGGATDAASQESAPSDAASGGDGGEANQEASPEISPETSSAQEATPNDAGPRKARLPEAKPEKSPPEKAAPAPRKTVKKAPRKRRKRRRRRRRRRR